MGTGNEVGFIVAQIELRRFRAVEVDETYSFEQVGLQSWVVMHPSEPDRSYSVDALECSCNCPDFVMRAHGWSIWCKHMFALDRRLKGALLLRRGELIRQGPQPPPAVRDADADGADPFARDPDDHGFDYLKERERTQ